MKAFLKQLFCLISFSIIVTTVSAQGFYIDLSGGYAFGTVKTNNGDFVNTITNQGNTTIEYLPISLGQGITAILSGGYLFNQYVGVDLNISYLVGTKHTFESDLTFAGRTTTLHTFRNSTINLIPSLKLMLPIIEDKLSLYTRFGISFPLFNKAFTTREGKSLTVGGWEPFYQESEIVPYFKIGYSTSIGVNYLLCKKIALFAELNSLIQSFVYKKETLTEATENGIDILSKMTIKQKETEYQKEINYFDSEDPDKPKQMVSQSISASSIGLMIGIFYKF